MGDENKQRSASTAEAATPYSFKLEDLTRSHVERELSNTAFSMKASGFHRWWFVIYRTTYDDDAAWERYIELLKFVTHKQLEDGGNDILLTQYLEWTVISDRATLDGASKADVRRHFKSWCANRSEDRDGPGASPTNKLVDESPRFNYCLYVDRQCLDTLARIPDDYYVREPGKQVIKSTISHVVVVLIDGGWDENVNYSSRDHRRHPEVEGCTKYYVGWGYRDIDCLVADYDELLYKRLSDGSDYQDYIRPPLVGPFGLESMPP